jgi:hypothetical protein
MKKCKLYPDTGETFFKKAVKKYGRDNAILLYSYFNNKKNINKSLSLDAEGFPSNLEDIENIKEVQDIIGSELLEKIAKESFVEKENNYKNYKDSIYEAYTFNSTSPYKDKFTAIVKVEENKVKVILSRKNEDTLKLAKEQYAAMTLNSKILEILKPLGITEETLISQELNDNGVIQWDKAKNIGFDISDLIKVANNEGGYRALSEEFSHLLVRLYYNTPLIQRALNLIKSDEDTIKNILGDKYEEYNKRYNEDFEVLAEEALGKVLQNTLLMQESNTTTSLFTRICNFIKSKFKKVDSAPINSTLETLNGLLNGETVNTLIKGLSEITTEQILESATGINVSLYDIENTINSAYFQFNDKSDIDIIKNIIIQEEKAKSLNRNPFEEVSHYGEITLYESLDKLKESAAYSKPLKSSIQLYLLGCIKSLKQCQNTLNKIEQDIKEGKVTYNSEYFQIYRDMKHMLDSKKPILEACMKSLEHSKDLKIFNDTQTEDITEKVTGYMSELLTTYNYVKKQYDDTMLPLFSSFIENYFGVTEFVVDSKGTKKSIKSLLKEANSDISIFSQLLDAMSDSSDILLQKLTEIIKDKKEEGRQNTIEFFKELQLFQQEAEREGINLDEILYQRDENGYTTGYYLQEIDWRAFSKARKQFWQQENEKFGDFLTPSELKQRMEDWANWKAENLDSQGFPIKEKYLNQDYAKLSTKEKEYIERYISYKESLDFMMGIPKSRKYHAIQIRKSEIQRIYDTSSVSEALSNIKNDIQDTFMVNEDADSAFGLNNPTMRVRNDLEGNDLRRLPKMYVNKLNDPSELSTDAIGTLMKYAYTSNNYNALKEIIDPLEIGRKVMRDRKVKKREGDKELISSYKVGNTIVEQPVYEQNQSEISKMYDTQLDIHVYSRKKDTSRNYNIPFTDKKISPAKTLDWLLGFSTTLQLGFNWLNDIANLTQGVLNTNNLAFAHKFISPSDLFEADKEYLSMLPSCFAELSSRTKSNKLSLFTEFFDTDNNFNQDLNKEKIASLIRRGLGVNAAFIVQEAGNHFLFNRAAIAYCKGIEVLKNGEKTNLWDALEVEHLGDGDSKIGRLKTENITYLDGTPVNFSKEKQKIHAILRRYLGAQSSEDQNNAKKYVLGRLLLNYKGWWKPLLNTRFQKTQYDSVLDITEEGFYTTVFRLTTELAKGERELSTLFDTLEPYEKQNLLSALTELLTFTLIYILANLNWSGFEDDDDDENWEKGFNIWKLCNYVFNRMEHEIGIFVPFAPLTFTTETIKLLENPIPVLGVVKNALKGVGILLNPTSWDDEVKTGIYKGMTNLEKALILIPNKFGAFYRQLLKIQDLETSVLFYTKQ